MGLAQTLRQEMENSYTVTEKLFRLVDSHQLDWKPPIGGNWMTVRQLLMHCASGCGMGIKGFVTGDWGMPEGTKIEDLTPEQMLPPAEKLPGVEDVEQAVRLLKEDRDLGRAVLATIDDRTMLERRFPAPWGGAEFTLFQHVLHMIEHLNQHKGQLFYYLKLMGKDVRTPDLWGDV
jgi:DinB superfamily